MKKLFRALGVSMFFIPILIVFASCGKSGGGAGGNGPGVNPIQGSPPVVSAVAPGKVWYDSTIRGSFTISGGQPETVTVTSSKGGAVTVSGTTYTIVGLTQPTDITITAKNKFGSHYQIVSGDMYSEATTKLCNPGEWKRTGTTLNGVAIAPSCLSVKMLPDGGMKVYNSQCGIALADGNSTWSLVNNGANMFFGQAITAVGVVPYIFESSTNSMFVLRYTDNQGNIVRWIFTH